MPIITQVLIQLFVAALSAWLGARLGVRSALEQAKKERAFDRRLEWYEKAIRITIRFQSLNERIAVALRLEDAAESEEMFRGVRDEKDPLLKELQQVINESMVFADRKTYLRLKGAFAKFKEQAMLTGELLKNKASMDSISDQYASMANEIEQIAFELAQSVRDQLGLDKITLADFEK